MATGEAAKSLSVAQGHLDADDFNEALRLGKQAQDLFQKASDWSGFADASRLIINGQCALEDRKGANSLAREILELLQKNGADDNAQATMKLSIAEVNSDKRGSKNREVAKKSAKEALATFQKGGDKKMQAATLLLLCSITLKDTKGSKDVNGKAARTYCVQALKLQRSLGDRKQEAIVMHNMATSFIALGDVRSALKASKEALRIFKELGEKKLEAYELQCTALWQAENDDYEAALLDAEAALAAAREVEGEGSRALEASILGTLVKIQGVLDKDHAVKSAKEGLRRFREEKDKVGEAQALMAFASATKDHDPQNALSTATRALDAFRATGDSHGERLLRRMLSELQIRVRRGDRALESAMLSLEMTTKQAGKDRKEVASATMTVCRAYLARGELDKVVEYANEAQSISKTAKWKKGQAEALKLLCQAKVALEDLEEGLQAVTQAKELMKEEGEKLSEVSLWAMMAEVQILQSDFKAAVETGDSMKVLGREMNDAGVMVNALLLSARAGVKLVQEENEKLGDESYEAAYSAATEALKLSRRLRDRQLVASAQYMMGELYLISADLEAALGAGIEAVRLSQFAGDAQGEASGLVLCSKLHALLTEMDEAWDTATRAMNLFRMCGDARGSDEAAGILEKLYPYFQQKNAPAQAAAIGTGAAAPSAGQEDAGAAMQKAGGAPEMKALGERQAVTGEITPDLIRSRIRGVLEENLNLDADDFEDDTPFMSAGVSSTGAIMLQAAVTQDFNSLKIPSTLIFDYPSMSAVVDFLMDQVAG